ncbi:MAG: substrate-binding domain-containing protein [Rhizomicrobium sp.]
MMRPVSLAAFLFLLSAPAQAAELQILSAPVVDNAGLKELVEDFTRQTGTKVTITVGEMLKIPGKVHAEPTDVFFLESDLMGSLAPGDAAKTPPPVSLGRVHIGLAVKAGAPHPDISTLPKFIAVLKSAKGVVYSNPDPARGSMVAKMAHAMMQRPDFAGVHGVISSKGNGVSGLINDEGDMALQLISEILPRKEVELVGRLPDELNAVMDISVGVSSKVANPAEAKAFIAFVMRPEAYKIWNAKGLDR